MELTKGCLNGNYYWVTLGKTVLSHYHGDGSHIKVRMFDVHNENEYPDRLIGHSVTGSRAENCKTIFELIVKFISAAGQTQGWILYNQAEMKTEPKVYHASLKPQHKNNKNCWELRVRSSMFEPILSCFGKIIPTFKLFQTSKHFELVTAHLLYKHKIAKFNDLSKKSQDHKEYVYKWTDFERFNKSYKVNPSDILEILGGDELIMTEQPGVFVKGMNELQDGMIKEAKERFGITMTKMKLHQDLKVENIKSTKNVRDDPSLPYIDYYPVNDEQSASDSDEWSLSQIMDDDVDENKVEEPQSMNNTDCILIALSKLGATCYMNSIIQAMFSSKEFDFTKFNFSTMKYKIKKKNNQNNGK